MYTKFLFGIFLKRINEYEHSQRKHQSDSLSSTKNETPIDTLLG